MAKKSSKHDLGAGWQIEMHENGGATITGPGFSEFLPPDTFRKLREIALAA